ncbi:MAG: hypothetical protein M3R61_10895, partial [Chloroflexota bacterium]|nr:hypothetical protein [Chloroflexota bacterium]
ADQEYAQLEQRMPDDVLLAALGALTSVYRQIQADLAAFERKLKQLAAALTAQATQARERMGRVRISFQRASAPSRRSWKTRRTISAPGRQRLDELQARQTQLDLQRAALAQAALPLTERNNRLAQLTHDYATLYGDATNLWQAECPRDYAASISAQQSQSYASATSDSSYTSPSSSTASSSSDYSSDWSSSSSEPSSDGGTW